MRHKITLILVLIGLLCNAQSWEPLVYSPDQNNLELNPLKGLTPLWSVSNDFPHSIRGKIISFGDIMNGIDDFNWSIFDNFINAQGNQGRFCKLQVNVDMGRPQSQVQIPAFLADDVNHFYYVGGANPGDNGISQLLVDYNDPEMMAALLNFIQRFGERYNDDPRVFLVHYGLYGVFGEWDLGYGGNFVPDGEDWEMTEENQLLITSTYEQYFDNKNLLARFPGNVPDPQVVGYSDGFYFGASISDAPNLQWFFYPKLLQSHADLNWKKYPIGGEVDPDVQPILWENFPNTVVGVAGVTQETDAIFELTHPTFLFQDHIFNAITEASHPVMWANAIKATKRTGYTYHINERRLTAANANPSIEVNIQNMGLAPIYANWEVEFAYLDSNEEIASLGTATNWNLDIIQPEVEDNYRSFLSAVSVPDGTHTILLKVKSPLEDLIPNPENAQPVRFANTTQDLNEEGWLTLGQLTITNGNAGVVPTPVTSISITPEAVVMGFESQEQLTAVVLPADATNPAVSWASSHPNTASVDENGLVTSYTMGGEAVITGYTQDGTLADEVFITVEVPSIEIPGLVQAEFFSDFNNLQVNPVPNGEPGGGDVLGFIGDDTWMEYMLDATQSGEYVVDFRASSFSGEGAINILNEAGTVLGSVDLSPATSNYDIYQIYTSDVINLPAGEQIIRLDVEASSFNLNWVEFRLNPCPGQDPSIIGTPCDDGDPETVNDRYNANCVCQGIALSEFVPIPSLIQAEDYYNVFNAQINEAPADEPGGGDVLGFIGDDTYMEYAVTVSEEADFIVDLRASSPYGVGVVNVLNELGDVLGTINLTPATSNYDTYAVFSSEPFILPEGNHLLRLDVVISAFNLNWVEFRLGPCAGFDLSLINTPCDDGDPNTENDRYNDNCDCTGIAVDEFVPIPALIEAEDYYDVFNVQINGAPGGEPGGDVLGFIADNTWMDYAVYVSETEEFVVDFRASSPYGEAVFNVLNEVGEVLATITLEPSTGSYDIYENFISSPFTLSEGYHKLRMDVVTSSLNLNWVEFKLQSEVSTNELDDHNFVRVYPNPVTNVLHVDVQDSNRSLTTIRMYDIHGRLLLQKETSTGSAEINVAPFNAAKILIMQIINNGQQTTRRIIIE